MRRAARVDANHAAIARALRAAGVSVVDLSGVGGGVPDLLCGQHGRAWLVEVKDGTKAPSRQRLRPSQRQFAATWRGGEVVVVTGIDEVEDMLRALAP